jgi:hypothetical protein
VGEAQPIDAGGPTATIIAEAGGDLAKAQDLHVLASGASVPLAFDALRVPGASLDAFVAAAAPRSAALGTTQRSSRSVGDWKVVRYATPSDFAGPPRALDYTSRGDVILIFGKWTEEQLAGLLAGWP